MRKRLWQLHSWLGLIAGLGLLVIGLTGSILVFHEELSAAFNAKKFTVVPSAAGRLSLNTLLTDAQRQLPNYEITGWTLQNQNPTHADDLYVIRHGDNVWLTATFDQYTGQLLSPPHLGTTALYGWLVELHSVFFADDLGAFITGLFAVILCLLGVSGVWLYREFWKNLFTFRWKRGARLLFSDLHKFTGITSVAFNLVLGFTGAYWNITRVAERVRGHEVPQTIIDHRLYSNTLSLDDLTRDAAARLPGFHTNFISLPSNPSAPAVILWGAVEPRPLLASPYGSVIFYDPQTGAHRTTTDLRTARWWERVTDTFKPVHFGNFGGIPVKLLWCLAGLAPGVLAISGFCIWRLRQRGTANSADTLPSL